MTWLIWLYGKKDDLSKEQIDLAELTAIAELLTQRMSLDQPTLLREYRAIIDSIEKIKQELQVLRETEKVIEVYHMHRERLTKLKGKKATDEELGDSEDDLVKINDKRREKICQKLGYLGTQLGNFECGTRSQETAKKIQMRALIRPALTAVANEVSISQIRIDEHKRAGNWF